MFHYYPTNGDRGEILVAKGDAFVGFIRNFGRADRWAAYDRNLKPLGEDYGSQGQAATACLHNCTGRPKILMRDVAMVEAQS